VNRPLNRLDEYELALEERDHYVNLLLGLISLGRRLSPPVPSTPGGSASPVPSGEAPHQIAGLALGLVSIGRCLERLLLADSTAESMRPQGSSDDHDPVADAQSLLV
jgi:hypothetical protein